MTSDDGEQASRWTVQRWLVRGALLLAGVLLLLVWLRGLRSSPTRMAGERVAALRVTCGGAAGGRCSRAAELRLFVSNGGRFRHVFAVGLDDRYALHWYAPRPPDVVSAVAPVGPAGAPNLEQPLGVPIALAADHVAGPLRVYALFSDAPLSAQELSVATAELRLQQRAPSALEALPLARTDVLQKSVLVDVE